MTDARNRIRGIPQPLPDGEAVRWQGAPDRRALARHALHLRVIGGYFGLIILAGLLGALRDGVAARQVGVTLATQVVLSALVLGAVQLYALLTARSTIYAITDRRVVLKVGIVLPTTINIPFHLVESASSRLFRDGTGQIALGLRPPDRLAFLHLWPHARPWHLRFPQPMLRGLTDPGQVAKIIREAAASSGPIGAEAPVPVEPTVSRPQPTLATLHQGAAT